ncbi:hypothetical protein EVAR_12560_1 [Eumeta japonica]|uniref:Uncharacterized protein n=1 Tax=Eumeta variegata TaxID=151549 RepID=A0A4C1UG12_EUMVA|nr:hypothetical protein EVAR_12560_1 [Eumeta japonica]
MEAGEGWWCELTKQFTCGLCAVAVSLLLGRIDRWSVKEVVRSALSLARLAQAERNNESYFFNDNTEIETVSIVKWIPSSSPLPTTYNVVHESFFILWIESISGSYPFTWGIQAFDSPEKVGDNRLPWTLATPVELPVRCRPSGKDRRPRPSSPADREFRGAAGHHASQLIIIYYFRSNRWLPNGVNEVICSEPRALAFPSGNGKPGRTWDRPWRCSSPIPGVARPPPSSLHPPYPVC